MSFYMDSLDERYRNGGCMRESDEPKVRDCVTEMRHMRSDPRILANQLQSMGCQGDWSYEREES